MSLLRRPVAGRVPGSAERQAGTPYGAAGAVGLVLASLLLALLVLEAGLRLLWDGYYEKYDPALPWGRYQFHPTRGWSLVPGLDSLDWDREYESRAHQNEDGFRGPRVAAEKPPGRIRLLALGDSFTYGQGVQDDESWPAVLEQLEPALQSVNTGVPGYSTIQQLIVLREEIARYRPDRVVVAFFWNDLRANLEWRYVQARVEQGELLLSDPDPASPLHPAFADYRETASRRDTWLKRVSYGSHAYRFLSDRLKVLAYRIRSWRGPDYQEVEEGLAAAELSRAWEITFAALREMRDTARAHGSELVVVLVPDQVQVQKDARVYGVPAEVGAVPERMPAFGAAAGIPVIDPAPALQARYEREGRPLYFPHDRHLNPRGQRALAQVMLRELRRRGLLPAAPPGPAGAQSSR